MWAHCERVSVMPSVGQKWIKMDEKGVIDNQVRSSN